MGAFDLVFSLRKASLILGDFKSIFRQVLVVYPQVLGVFLCPWCKI